MMRVRRALGAAALLLPLVSAACGVPLMKLPSGPRTPAPDISAALDQATRGCRAIHTLTAEISVSGNVATQSLRARLLAGVAAPADLFLDAPAPFGASVFQLAARGDEATLLLPRDRRVLTGAHTADVIEAIAGIPLTAEDLRMALTGCARTNAASGGESVGENWRIVPGDEEIYLHRETAALPWRVAAVTHQMGGGAGWRAEYQDFRNGWPSTVRFVSLQSGQFDLRLSISQVETNTALDPGIFRVSVPAGFGPVTLDELRQSGPLAHAERDRQR
ncbi:MAG: hypothetical protein LBQ09_07040 [Acidobacteriaceae bacterium]|jgi:hypothetical protein|nr:hypothetical protein [Acidobacteriaceae bacterium]